MHSNTPHPPRVGGVFLLLALMFIVYSASPAGARVRRYVRPAPPPPPETDPVKRLIPEPPVPNNSMGVVTLDRLEAEFMQNRRIVHVKGRLTNISKVYIRGHLTVHLLSSSGVSLFSTDIPLNNHNPFGNGESVTFDTAINVSAIRGAAKVSLDFTQD
jgi:hypothetical protein